MNVHIRFPLLEIYQKDKILVKFSLETFPYLHLKGQKMYKGYKAAKNKEDIGNALKRMQDNIVILQNEYSKASEIAKPKVKSDLKNEIKAYISFVLPLIDKNVMASDPAGIIYQNAVQAFDPIVNEIASELMQNIETAEEAIKVAEVIGENAKKVGILTKIKVGVYKSFQLIWDAAKGAFFYIIGAFKGTFDFAKAKAIGIKEYMLWLVNKNEQYDYSL